MTGCVPHGQFTLILIHHLDGNTVQFGLADDAGAGFHRQQQPKFPNKLPRKCVIGGRRRACGTQSISEPSRRIKRCNVGDTSKLPQPIIDALPQLLRGLPGEGEAQHLVGVYEAIGHKPHHPGRHGFGFTSAGTGHHQHGAKIGLYYGRLLLRRGVFLPQQPGEFDGINEHETKGITGL